MRSLWEQLLRHVPRDALAGEEPCSAENPPYIAYLIPASLEPISGDTSDPRNKTFAGVFTLSTSPDAIVIDPKSPEPFPISAAQCEEYVLRVFWPTRTNSRGMEEPGADTSKEYTASTLKYSLHDGYGNKSIGAGGRGVGSGAITMESCLQAFVEREQLGKDDKWYCPKCKEFVRAYKKFDLFTVGEIIIVHLKRFKYSGLRTSYWGASAVRDKISELVDFPIEGLDLSPYVMGKQPGPHIYDLYAVSEHSGGLGGGHYTATARNWSNGKWYSFNDSFVRELPSGSSAVSRSAYVLFYRRRGGAPMRIPLLRHVLPNGELNPEDDEVAAALHSAKTISE
jgi:hypothetical protein